MMQRRDNYVQAASASSSRSNSSTSVVSAPPEVPSPRGRPSRRKRRSINNRREEESFLVTFIKVGVSVFLVSALCYLAYAQRQLKNDDVFRQQPLVGNHPSERHGRRPPKNKKAKPHPPLPMPFIGEFDQDQAKWDAYGIAYKVDSFRKDNSTAPGDAFAQKTAQLRSQFATLVGYENEARAILQRSLLSIVPSNSQEIPSAEMKETSNTHPQSLAYRLRSIIAGAKDGSVPTFSIAILGSTAAAGSGIPSNHSYAFQVEKIMTPLFDAIGIRLKVQNLAMEDTTEFPSIWCLDHFLSNNKMGNMPDMLVWDYGLTSTPESFEAFLRNVAGRTAVTVDGQTKEHRRPFLVIRDNKIPAINDQRDRLLQAYVDQQVIVDPLLVHVDRAGAPYQNLRDEGLAEIFQGWRMPGRGDPLLTARQHNLTAWLISMHFLSVMELLVADRDDKHSGFLPQELPVLTDSTDFLPPPLVIRRTTRESWALDEQNGEEMILKAAPAWLPMLIGEPAEKPPEKFRSEDEEEEPTMFKFSQGLQCQTSYITSKAPDTLDELIVAGVVSNPWDEDQGTREKLLEDLLLPKSSMFSFGWVQDLDKLNKRKIQLSKERGSDVIKKSYFGMPRSGDLTLFIPLSGSDQERATTEFQEKGFVSARDFIETVTICETDLSYDEYDSDSDNSCRLYRDAYVYVGGEMAFLERVPVEVSSSCISINVPDSSGIVYKDEVVAEANKKKKLDIMAEANKQKKQLDMGAKETQDGSSPKDIGLPIVIQVRSHGYNKDPCTVAHVLWSKAEYQD